MANHKSAEKRNRQAIVRRANNKAAKSRVRTVVKNLRLAIEEKNKEEATKLFTSAQSLFGKLAKTSAMKTKTASRKTSRLASQIAQL